MRRSGGQRGTGGGREVRGEGRLEKREQKEGRADQHMSGVGGKKRKWRGGEEKEIGSEKNMGYFKIFFFEGQSLVFTVN